MKNGSFFSQLFLHNKNFEKNNGPKMQIDNIANKSCCLPHVDENND